MAATIGSVCGVKSLYNHSSSPRHDKWSEYKDPIEEEKRAKSLGQSFAVVRRYAMAKDENGETFWRIHSIEVKSPRLQEFIDEILSDYQGARSDDAPYTFLPPFKPIIHRWGRIQDAVKNPDADPSLVAELQVLRQEFTPLIESRLSELNKIRETNLVSFKSLWLAYSPGDLVVSCITGNFSAFQLAKMKLVEPDEDSDDEGDEKKKPYWHLLLKYLDWNGSYCGYDTKAVNIPYFEGQCLAARLSVCPLEFYPDSAKIRAQLLARGKKFADLRGYHVVNCNTKKFVEDCFGNMVPKPVSGRVIVDAFAFYKCQERVSPTLSRLNQSSNKEKKDLDESKNEAPGGHDRKEEILPLTNIECILASASVRGFDLKNKEWCEFNVSDIQDTTWVDVPYDNLVLPTGEKDLVFAFAAHPRLRKKNFDDFVEEKGQGIIILLCGPPGVGKTLTAEAVAERSRVPLYILTAGDLGINAERVEKVLDNALECCRLWDAVLLLDEADVFMETRNSDSLARNELTSIFLRCLEYYRGIMFLTTNRISSIDPAFKSRLDLILPYYDLSPEARRAVWVNFIKQQGSGASVLGDADFYELAKVKLNGREIKNSVKTALVLAGNDSLTMEHIRVVLGIRERVKDYENGIRPARVRRVETLELENEIGNLNGTSNV